MSKPVEFVATFAVMDRGQGTPREGRPIGHVVFDVLRPPFDVTDDGMNVYMPRKAKGGHRFITHTCVPVEGQAFHERLRDFYAGHGMYYP